MDLVAIFPFMGRSQLEVLVVLASTILLVTHGVTAYFVEERVLVETYGVIPLFLKSTDSMYM